MPPDFCLFKYKIHVLNSETFKNCVFISTLHLRQNFSNVDIQNSTFAVLIKIFMITEKRNFWVLKTTLTNHIFPFFILFYLWGKTRVLLYFHFSEKIEFFIVTINLFPTNCDRSNINMQKSCEMDGFGDKTLNFLKS